MSPSTVLVIRATGAQGRQVCAHSLQQGFKVNALVRDTTEDRARALQDMGAKLHEGSLNDREAVDKAIQGCDKVFLALMPSMSEPGSEIRQANLVLDAARAAGVRQLVYSSVIGGPKLLALLDNEMYRGSLEAKSKVEEMVRSSGIPNITLLRPGFFMTNFFSPLGGFMFPELASRHELVNSFEPTTQLPLVDPADIGAFAAAAMADPTKYHDRAVTVVSELQDVEAVVAAISHASGHAITTTYRSDQESRHLAKTNPIITGQLMTRRLADVVDLDATRAWGVPWTPFAGPGGFLEREAGLVRSTFGGAPADTNWQTLLSKPA